MESGHLETGTWLSLRFCYTKVIRYKFRSLKMGYTVLNGCKCWFLGRNAGFPGTNCRFNLV